MNPFGWLMLALTIPSALLFIANARHEKRTDGTWRATRREVCQAAACYVAVLALLIAMPAQASEPWTGTQLMVNGNGSTVYGGTKLTGAVTYFYVSAEPKTFVFAYGGAEWVMPGGIAVNPQLGIVGGWFDGHDGFIQAVTFSGRLGSSLDWLADAEHLAHAGARDYYGYYRLDWRGDGLRLGLHAEQVNRIVRVGPHIGFVATTKSARTCATSSATARPSES